MKQKWKDALNTAAAEPTGWGSSMPEQKMTLLVRRANEAKVSGVTAMDGLAGASKSTKMVLEIRKETKCHFAGSKWCTGMHTPSP